MGLGNLPTQIRKSIQFVPDKISALLRSAVDKVARKVLPTTGTTDPLYANMLGPMKSFSYQGVNYRLWTAKDGGTAKVKIAKEVNGTFKFVGALTDKSFENTGVATTAVADITNLVDKSKELAAASVLPKAPAMPAPSKLAELANLQAQVIAAQNKVYDDIMANACAALMAGCFAAGTKLWTPDGYRNVEDIQEGEFVYSRDEWDPDGAIESKVVEAKFERTGRILHLHLSGGAIIRTTPEHPFYERQRGWLEAGALQASDEIRTDSGWVRVGEVFDTGEYETVYNLRATDHHTYFVGEETWRFAVWAHNAYVAPIQRNNATWGPTFVAGRTVYGEAQNSQAAQGVSNQSNAHFNRVNAIVAALAPTAPEGTYFVLNRSWRTALGRPNVGIDPIFKPDIIIVQPLDPPGAPNRRFKIYAIEVDHPQNQTYALQQLASGWATVNQQNGEIQLGGLFPVELSGSLPTITW